MVERPLASLDVAVLGLGAVGTALARALEREGSRRSLWLYSRRPGAAAALASELRRKAPRASVPVRASEDLATCARGVDTALLCARDDEILDRAREIALAAVPRASAVLLHASGYHGVEVLAPAASAGWSTGGLHPLAAIPRSARHADGDEPPLANATFAIAGDARALALARRIAGALGGSTFELAEDSGGRARYHAAAALLSNGLVALFDAAEELLASATSESDALRGRALAHLLETTAQGLGRAPTQSVLTGPIARGDPRVVAGHVAALRDRPRSLELYRLLSARMVELARRVGRVEPAILDEIAALLSADHPPP